MISLITGQLFRDPERRISKNDKPFVMATLAVKEGDATIFVKLFVFSESTGEEMLRLAKGDHLSAQGRMKVELYGEDGQQRLSYSMTADAVLVLRAKPKERRKGGSPPPPEQATPEERHPLDRYGGASADSFSDSIPF